MNIWMYTFQHEDVAGGQQQQHQQRRDEENNGCPGLERASQEE